MYNRTSFRIRGNARKLMNAGMNVARLNFSHGSHEEHKARIDTIRKVAKRLNKTIGLLLDTKGQKFVRTI